uniref:Uncharacterized protein n=1 Tax=viral metagenome TaxID=1070528 RepID=A0A6M3LR08_9ZZZZ
MKIQIEKARIDSVTYDKRKTKIVFITNQFPVLGNILREYPGIEGMLTFEMEDEDRDYFIDGERSDVPAPIIS